MVATQAILSGTHLGSFLGVAPTGKRLSWGVLLMDQIVDGRIILHYANADWISALIQLGVISPPGQARDSSKGPPVNEAPVAGGGGS